MKKLLIGFAAFILSFGLFAGCTSAILPEDNQKKDTAETTTEQLKELEDLIEILPQALIVSLDEETNMYQFAYKKSVLNISRKMFDEYELENDNVQKFFDKMEEVYVLFADFFMVHNLPDVFTYNSVTREYKESVGANANAFALIRENSTNYVEGLLEGYLQDIDTRFPAIVSHEVGHLYTSWHDHNKGIVYNGIKYVWDSEVFATIATEYLFFKKPDFNLGDVTGEYLPITERQKNAMGTDGYDEWFKTYQGFIYFKIFSIIEENGGYDTLHEVLAKMVSRSKNSLSDGVDIIQTFDLFFEIYSEMTGVNLIEKYFAQEELYATYKGIEPYWEPQPLQ